MYANADKIEEKALALYWFCSIMNGESKTRQPRAAHDLKVYKDCEEFFTKNPTFQYNQLANLLKHFVYRNPVLMEEFIENFPNSTCANIKGPTQHVLVAQCVTKPEQLRSYIKQFNSEFEELYRMFQTHSLTPDKKEVYIFSWDFVTKMSEINNSQELTALLSKSPNYKTLEAYRQLFAHYLMEPEKLLIACQGLNAALSAVNSSLTQKL